MKKWLPVVLILIVIIELSGILLVGDWIGGWNTILLILMIGFLGVIASVYEGRKVLTLARQQMNAGQIPGRSLINGVCILIGGLLLIIPGFFSDIIGLLLIIPFTRYIFEGIVLKWIEKAMNNGNFLIRRF